MGNATILRKLLLWALLLMVLALGSAAIFLSRYTVESERRRAEDTMAAQAKILLPMMAVVDPPSVGVWTGRAGRDTGARVTVIGRSGEVLADSQHDRATMDNHAGRPEVRQAMAGAVGVAVRHSATLDVDLCYLAEPAVLADGSGVILRLAVPLRQIDAEVNAVRWVIVRASLLALVFALLVAFFASRAFSQRVRRIETYAQKLVNAEYSGTLAHQADDELGSVARSLRGMAERFRSTLSTLDDEMARRKALLSGMVEGVLAVDRDLRVTFCNNAFARAFKAPEPAPEHVPVVEVVRHPELLDLLRGVIATGQPARRRLTLRAAESRVFDIQGTPVAGHSTAGAIAVLHDVTDLETLERARKDFVSNISHELRTPLASIRGYAETLLDGAADDPANHRKFLEAICRNTVRLSEMAADVLALCELEADPRPTGQKVGVREEVLAALNAVENEAVARQVDVFAGAIEDVHVMGQRFRLEHALVNLLHHAIRSNRPKGEVRLDALQIGETVRITISYTGNGAPFTEPERIFEQIQASDQGPPPSGGGAGLGLMIVKHLVERMGGAIGVESHLGRGTVFTLQFPAAGSLCAVPDAGVQDSQVR